jgi:hypothetical protein
MDAVFAAVKSAWGSLDFLLHAIAFSDKDQLDGRYVDTTEDNFIKTMVVSCYSFTALAQRAEKLMTNGGSTAPKSGCRTTTSWGLPRRRWNRRCDTSRPISASRISG